MRLRSALAFVASYLRPARVRHLTPEEVMARLDEERFFVYDCNDRAEFDRGHVPRSVHVAWDAVDPALLPADREAALVFYCAAPL